MRTLTVEDVRKLDQKATEKYGIPSLLLMEAAGRGVTQVLLSHLEKQPKITRVLVVCGSGNNAGDGFAIARMLHHQKIPTHIYLLNPKTTYKGDAETNFHIVQKLGLPITPFAEFENDLDQALKSIPLVVVDAMLGTGFKGKPRPEVSTAIQQINNCKKSHSARVSVLAVDIPSGLNGNVGPETHPAVQADCTVTFVAAKKGMVRPESKRFVGKIEVVDIGIPHDLL